MFVPGALLIGQENRRFAVVLRLIRVDVLRLGRRSRLPVLEKSETDSLLKLNPYGKGRLGLRVLTGEIDYPFLQAKGDAE
jgi:hypothetical protein